MESKNNRKDLQKFGEAASLGFNMAAGMAIFSYLGYRLDQTLGGGRAWTLTGMFLGLFYCGYEVWKIVRRMQADDQKKYGKSR